MTTASRNRALNGSHALEHHVEATEDLSPEAINNVLDAYAAERWGERTEFRTPDPRQAEFRSLSEDRQSQYWMEHAATLDLDHSANPLKTASEFTAVVFETHHQALSERDAKMDDITTDSGEAQYIRNTTDRATMQHYSENFTAAILQGDWQQASHHYEEASRAAIDTEHKFDLHDPSQMFILDPSILRAHYTAIVHIEWMEAEHALIKLESNGADTRHLRTLAQLTQRGSVNYVMPGINDDTDEALAPDSVETKLAELRYAPQHFLKLLENRLDYTPMPGTEFPNLPAADHTELTSQHLNEYIAQLYDSTDLAFQTTWASAIEHLADQAATLHNMENTNFPGIDALTTPHRQIAYQGAEALDALLHTAENYDINKAGDDQKPREALEAGLSAMHQLGYSDDDIVVAIASSSFPNGYISSRNSEIAEWTHSNTQQVTNAEQALNQHGFVNYLRSEQGDSINRRNDDVHHAIAYNPNGELMHIIDSLEQTEAKLLDELKKAIDNSDLRSIEATKEQLAQLNDDYEPVASIQRRRAVEHEAEIASYNRQAHNILAISNMSEQYARHIDNSAGFDTMLGVRGTERLINQIAGSRYTGHDADIAELRESAQRWQERLSE